MTKPKPKPKPKPPAGAKPKTPAKPPVQLQYLLWDATNPVDSNFLGQGLEGRFRWQNLLVDSPATEDFVVPGPPRLFQLDVDSNIATLGAADIENRNSRGVFEFARAFFDPVHHNAGNDRPNLLAFSGHGMPGFAFGDNDIQVCASRPLTPSPAPNLWTFDRRPVRPKPALQWNHPSLQVVLLSACRQLAGRPQQFYWSQAMRGAHPVHLILGYRETAPDAKVSAVINREFLKNLFGSSGKDGQKIFEAWKNAHMNLRKSYPGLPGLWAALCYKSSLNDRLDVWTRTGKMASSPDSKEDILYFDSANLSGRVVTEPHQDLDCFLTARGSPIPFHPWKKIPTGAKLDLHVQFVNPGESFQNFDEVWITVIQVRPDFEALFDIEQLIIIDDLSLSTVIHTALLAHSNFPGFIADTYRFTIDRASLSKLMKFDPTFNEFTMPIEMGILDNLRHRPCYFMIRVSNLDAPKSLKLPPREFGMPTVHSGAARRADLNRLIDDFQFSVFLPPWP